MSDTLKPSTPVKLDRALEIGDQQHDLADLVQCKRRLILTNGGAQRFDVDGHGSSCVKARHKEYHRRLECDHLSRVAERAGVNRIFAVKSVLSRPYI
jgi:hypothetical protein